MELHAFILSLLLLTIVSNTESRSLETTYKCATTCREPANILFREGYTYNYNYAAAVVSTFQDGPTADQSSEINIQARAMIDVLSPCEMVLRITDASIRNNDYIPSGNAQQWVENIERNPLHFNFQDGTIPDVCASNDDPTWVLNIKRGILSTLQVSSLESADAIKETDVTGACESSYTVENNDGSTEIVKRKDYNKCEGRDKYLLFSHFTPYNSESPRQSFIHSTQTCTQRVRGTSHQGTICEEEHVFRPFSNAESGARTVIRQSIQLYGQNRYYSGPTLGLSEARRTNLVFESEEDMATSTDITELRTLYSELCSTMSGENYKQVGKDFIKMVFLLRRLDAPAIEQAYSSLDGACPRWEAALKDMFRDALQWCGSEGCVVFATRLIEAGPESLPDEIASRWLTGMSLVTKPTLPMLSGMMTVVQSGRLTQQSYLTAGTMIHRLCASSTSNCLTEPIVTQALAVFEDKLGVNCRTTNQDQKQDILLSLRALGNAGRSSAISTLAACAQEEGNDMETRIAAVETFRRMPCNTDRSALSRMVFDFQQDSEIRIASYLSVMKCPTPSLIQQIVILLDNEPVQQVSSFIWSHVKQTMESDDPLKGYIKPMLMEAEFAKTHDLDPRKYSRFYEASLFSEALNAGATVESSVVWSPKSFVPRSAELDLTVDVFGQAVNLLEMGGRVEGVEKMIQTALASDGFLKNNPLSDLFMTADDDDEDDDDEDEVEGIEEETLQRTPRETDGYRLMELQNQYKTDLKTEDTPNANWYLRVFGNEMFYQNTRSMKEKFDAVDMRSMFTQLAQGGRYEYHDDTMLMNSAHVLPTGLGLPLTIAFNGSASVDVNAQGNLDIAGLFANPTNVGIEGSLNPRAVILITGSMSVDAVATKTGIATESSATSSWTIGGRASIVNSRSVEVRIDAPYNRNTLFSFNHKLMKLNGDESIDIGTTQNNIHTDCSRDIGGQHFCMESPSSVIVFPISGPIAMSAYMEKVNNHFDHYLLEGRINPQYNGALYPSQFDATLRLDTPGSTVNRETVVTASYNLEEMQFALTMQRPETSVALRGNFELERLRKHAVVTYTVDEAETTFQGTLLKEYDGSETRWAAATSLQTPSKTISISANAAFDPTSSVSASLNIENLLPSPVVISASLQDNSLAGASQLRYQGNGQLTIPGFADSDVQFNMHIKPQSDVFIFGLEYTFSGMPERSIHLLHKRRDLSTSTTTRWEAEQKLTMTQFPDFNHHVGFSFSNGPGQVQSFVKIGFGRHAGHSDNSNYVLLNQTLAYSTGEMTTLDANMDVQISPIDVAYAVNVNHRYTSSMVDSNLRVGAYGMRFFAQDNTPANGLINKEVRVEIPTPWGDLRVHDSIEETRRNVYTLRGEFGVGTSQGLAMNGQCDIENLRNRKSITINVEGDSGNSLMNAESVFKYIQPAGFSWQSNMASKYNNRVSLNLRHEGNKEGGFESTFMMAHQPEKFLKAFIDFESSEANSKRYVRIDFKDASATRRFMEMNANRQTSVVNAQNIYNASVSFNNNIPSLTINNLAGNVMVNTSSSSYGVGGSVVYNEEEIVGVDSRYQYAVQSSSSGLTTFSINLRQRCCRTLPNSVTATASVHNTLSEGHSVDLTFSKNGEEKMASTISVNNDMTRYVGSINQQMDIDTYPESMSFDLQKLRNGIDGTITYSRSSLKTVRLNIVSNSETSVTATWSHDDRDIRAPRSVEATLEWGTRARDSGKGIWLVSTIDRNQPLNAEIMLFNNDEKSFSAKLQHQVRRLASTLPQVNFDASVQGSLESADMRWLLELDGETSGEFILNWQTGVANFKLFHTCPFLHRSGFARDVRSTLRWSATEQPIVDFTATHDGLHASASLSVAANELSIRYFSNCSHIAGNLDITLQKSVEHPSVSITITQDQVTKSARLGYNYDMVQGHINAQLTQNLYEDASMSYIPFDVRFSLTIPSKTQGSFSAKYNLYRISYQYELETSETSAVYTEQATYNLFEVDTETSTRWEVVFFQSPSITYTERYTIGDEPERMMNALLSYAEDADTMTKTLTASLKHDDPHFMEWGLSGNSKIVLAATRLNYGLKGSIETTVDDVIQAVNVLAQLNPEQYSLRLGMNHNSSMLENFGVIRTFAAEGHARPLVNGELNGVTLGGSVQINEDSYEMDGSWSMTNRIDEAEMEINTELSHNIKQLYDIGIPLRFDATTNVGYGVVGGELSGTTRISTTITRTMLDEETGERYEIENHAHTTIDIQLFSWNVAFTGSHDFSVSFLPNHVKYEIAASGSTPSSHVFHKSLSLSITSDGKKQVGSITVNYNPTDRSFTFDVAHNATSIYNYGIPKVMTINFRQRDVLDFDLGIVYDASKKNVGFKFDYHGQRNQLELMFSHNFDIIVEQLGIPKRMGVEIAIPFTSNDAEFELRYVWGQMIKVGHVTLRWEIGTSPSFTLTHHQNITTADVFPRSSRMTMTSTVDKRGFNTRLTSGSKYVSVSFDHQSSEETPYTGTVTIRQNIDSENLPRTTSIEASLSSENVLDFSVSFDREVKLHTVVKGVLNMEEKSASMQIKNTQEFYPTDVFPTNFNFYLNGSISSEIGSYLKLSRDGASSFVAGFKSGINPEAQSWYFETIHSQREWKKIIPKKFRMDVTYSSDIEGNQRSVLINLRHGKNRNQITLGSSFDMTEGAVFGKLSYTHDFEEYQEVVPMSAMFNSLLEKSSQSIRAQVNATLGEMALIHAIEAFHNCESSSGTAKIEMTQDNIFLEPYNVPHTISASITSDWENEISSNIRTQYGDKTASLRLSTDKSTRAELEFSHTWGISPRMVAVVLSRPEEGLSATLSLSVDEVERQIHVSGSFAENQINVHFTHEFDSSLIARDITLAGRYRLSPDVHMSLDITQDGQSNEITFGYEYTLSSEAVYSRLSYTHNFVGYQETIPMSGMFTILLVKPDNSISAQMNVTLDGLSLTHSFKATCDCTDRRIAAGFELQQDNVFLEPYNIPHTLAGKITSEWEQDISVIIQTQYEDRTANLQFSTDKATRAELEIEHTWEISPHSIHIVLSQPEESSSLTVSLIIDGVEKQITLSGSLVDNEGEIHFTHEFVSVPIPRDITIQGSYRLSPDYHFAVGASVDGQEHGVAAGYTPLEDGFHITSTLFDDVTRSAKFRKNIVPGGISIDVDHNIPELLTYLPRSFGVAASAKATPRPNVTLSVRHQAETRMFSAQADTRALRFALKHDFDLPIPRDIIVQVSGSTTPYQASATITIEGTERTIRGMLDLESMMASLVHSIPELPFPHNVEVSISASSAPLSAGLSFTVEGLERTISASLDKTNMQGRLQHSIPELDRLFVARDIVLAMKGSMEPISGEVTVSLNGVERRIAAVADRPGMFFSFFQNLPELNFIPRNITFSIKGSMEPLSGSLRLSIDDVERRVDTEVNLPNRFATMTHSTPEFDPFIPRHVSVSAGFTKTAGRVGIEFLKNSRMQSADFGVNVNENSIRVQLTHSIDTLYDIPASMAIEVSGSIEHKNATVYLSVDHSFVNLGAELLTGDEGWYGASAEIQHNIEIWSDVPRTFSAMMKGRKAGKTFESALSVTGLEDHDYSGVATIQPTLKAKRAILEVAYDHTYNGQSRSVTGSLSASRKNMYKVMLDVTQSAPERKEIHLTANLRSNTEDNYQFTFGLESTHNMPELNEYGIPSSVQNGQVTLTIIPDLLTVRGEANVQIDNQPIAYSFNLNAQSSSDNFGFAYGMVVDDVSRNNAFSGQFSVNVLADSVIVSHTYSITNRNNREILRNDNVVLTITLDPLNPAIRLRVNQPELNELGVPFNSEISFSQRSVGDMQVTELLGSYGGLPIHVKFIHRIHLKPPIQIYLFLSVNQSIPFLVKHSVPKYASSEVSANADYSEGVYYDYSETMTVNKFSITRNATVKLTKERGSASYGFFTADESMEARYTYAVADNVLELTEEVEKQRKQIGNSRYTINLKTYEMSYSSHFDGRNVNVVVSFNFARPKQTINISIQVNEVTMLLLDFKNIDNKVNLELINRYNTPGNVTYSLVKNSAGYTETYSSVISMAEGDYTTNYVSEPYSESKLKGQQVTFSHVLGSKTLSSHLIAAGDAEMTSGKFELTITNKNMLPHFASKTQVTGNVSPKVVHVVFEYGGKGWTFDYNRVTAQTVDLSVEANGVTILSLNFKQADDQVNFELINRYNTPGNVTYSLVKNSVGYTETYSSVISMAEGDYSTNYVSEPYSESKLKGQQVTVSHVLGSKTLSSNLVIAGDAQTKAGKFELTITNNNMLPHFAKKTLISAECSPEEIHTVFAYGRKRWTFDYTNSKSSGNTITEMNFYYNRINFLRDLHVPKEIHSSFVTTTSDFSGTVRADDVVIFSMDTNPARLHVRIVDFAEEELLSIAGTYTTINPKSVDVTFVAQQLAINMHFTAMLNMFEVGTGNSSLSVSLVDNINAQRVDFIAFASPTSIDAEDFLLGLTATSTIPVMPFNIRMKYNSTWDENTDTYFGGFSVSYNNVQVSLDGKFNENRMAFKLVQPWCESMPVIKLARSLTIDSEEYKVSDMRLQWNTEEDSISMKLRYKNVGTNLFDSVHITQPSSLFGISDYYGNFFLDFRESDTFNFGINSNVNMVETGFNVSYSGVLPQTYGSHNIKVDVKQLMFEAIPKHFATVGAISIAPAGTYHSDWRITSQNEELVVLKKNFIPTDNGVSYDLLWRQKLFSNAPLSYVSTRGLLESTDIGLNVRGNLQIDSLPEMSGQLTMGTTGDSDRVNSSLSVSVSTGPLSRWLKVRTMSFSTWYKSEFDGRQSAPAFSATVVIDGKTYQIETSRHYVSSRKTTRLDGNISITHPLELSIFGLALPKRTEASINALSRSKGSRIFVSYNDDRMDYPFRMTSHYRFNNGDVLFEITSDMKYGPEEADNDMTMRMNIAQNDSGMDRVMTVSMQYPEYGINGDLVVGGVNSDRSISFTAVMKDYSLDQVATWEMRLSFDKQQNIIELYLKKPELEAITLRGDLSQVIGQGQRIMGRMAADAMRSQLRIVKGMTPTTNGYDMYIGYEVEGDATYTLHLVLEAESKDAEIILQTKKNFELDSEIARASVRLIEEQLIQLKLSANPVIVKFLQKMVTQLDTEVTRKVNWFADNAVEFLESLKTIVTGNQQIESVLAERIDLAIANVNALRDIALRRITQCATSCTRDFDLTGASLETLVRELIMSMLNQIDSLKAIVLQPFVDLREEYYGALLRQVNAILERKLHPITVELRKANAGELFVELVEEATRNTLEFIMANGEACLIAARRPLSELLAVTETEMIFNIPLQFELDHFIPLPTVGDLKKWLAQSALAIKIDDTVNVVYSYADEYYKARSLVYIPKDEILPPFKGHAFVSGFRHFSTFDKRHFGFTSGCETSHVLAADHRDGNFTIAVSYAEDQVHSIEVIVANRHVVVSSDYKVSMHGRVKQLPLDLDLLTVTLEGNSIHIRRPEGDLDVACDFTKELCTVDVSPYYFGATAGLAGVYNNEPIDDFMTPTHQTADTPEELAASWEASGTTCASGNTYRPCDSNSVSSACTALFEDLNSPMRPCFPLVDPTEFMSMCRDDMCNSQDSTKTCAAAHAYAYRCNLVGAHVTVPDECVVCSDSAGNEFDATQSQDARISGLDVVLVVEQGSCMSQRGLYKSMRKFMKRLSGSLSEARMRDNRFHLVGYGGPGASSMPHTFTIKSNRFTDRKNDVVKALRKIALSSEQIKADSLSALSYATQLPFRAGSQPVIVLLSCDECHSDTEVSYSNLEHQLRTQGIHFHHMPQKHIAAGKKASSVYGYSQAEAFSKGTNTISSDTIKTNKDDMCAPLATMTGGSVWDATHLSRSDFVAKASQFIVGKVEAQSRLTCTCAMNEMGIPSSVCTV